VMEDYKGRQCAHLAAMRNHKKVLQLLFDLGVDLDCRCETGKTPVHYASQYGGMCTACFVDELTQIKFIVYIYLCLNPFVLQVKKCDVLHFMDPFMCFSLYCEIINVCYNHEVP